jgi:hypothetical protein
MEFGILATLTQRGDRMTGRNNKPDNDGPASNPERLDQFGDALASRNEEEFRTASEQECESVEDTDHKQ